MTDNSEIKSHGLLKGHLAAAGAYVIFGVNIVTTKDIALSGMVTPIALFTMRAIGATVLFWALSLFTRNSQPERNPQPTPRQARNPQPHEKVDAKDLPKIAAASVLGLFIPQLSFLAACHTTTAIDISILGSLAPIFTMFAAAIALKEPITFKKALGVAISFVGVLTLIFNSVIRQQNGVDVTSPWGVVLMLINGISFACYLGIFMPLISKYSVVTFMKWMFLFSLLISLPFSFRDLCATHFNEFPHQVILEIAFLIFFATFISYILILVAQKNIRPTLVSMYSYLQPLIAVVIAVIIGMDTLTWQKVLATVLIFAGVFVVNGSKAGHAFRRPRH